MHNVQRIFAAVFLILVSHSSAASLSVLPVKLFKSYYFDMPLGQAVAVGGITDCSKGMGPGMFCVDAEFGGVASLLTLNFREEKLKKAFLVTQDIPAHLRGYQDALADLAFTALMFKSDKSSLDLIYAEHVGRFREAVKIATQPGQGNTSTLFAENIERDESTAAGVLNKMAPETRLANMQRNNGLIYLVFMLKNQLRVESSEGEG
jgi:hypothetical protein